MLLVGGDISGLTETVFIFGGNFGLGLIETDFQFWRENWVGWGVK